MAGDDLGKEAHRTSGEKHALVEIEVAIDPIGGIVKQMSFTTVEGSLVMPGVFDAVAKT